MSVNFWFFYTGSSTHVILNFQYFEATSESKTHKGSRKQSFTKNINHMYSILYAAMGKHMKRWVGQILNSKLPGFRQKAKRPIWLFDFFNVFDGFNSLHIPWDRVAPKLSILQFCNFALLHFLPFCPFAPNAKRSKGQLDVSTSLKCFMDIILLLYL